jgi:predicted N-acetyltransferase YhbS
VPAGEGVPSVSHFGANAMTSFDIRLETPDAAPALSQMSAEAFGPGRFARSAYRVREGVAPVAALSLTGWLDGRLVGGIRFTAIRIGAEEGGLLLGPLVVDPAVKGKGYGKALVGEGLRRAAEEGFAVVLLVGDMPYYGRFGFAPVRPGRISLPGPVDPARLLAFELKPDAIENLAGPVKAYARGGAKLP